MLSTPEATQDGVLVAIPGEKEKNAVVQSIDPVTGQPTQKLNDFMDKEYTKLTIKAKMREQDKEFQFIVMNNGEKSVLISNGLRLRYSRPFLLRIIISQNPYFVHMYMSPIAE